MPKKPIIPVNKIFKSTIMMILMKQIAENRSLISSIKI
jgi:hypothetical protein